MKAGKTFFSSFWARRATSDGASSGGGSSRGRKIIKNSTIGIVTMALLTKIKFFVTRDTEFEGKMRLVFPNYNSHLETDQGKRVEIVSENQIEYVIKLCNQYYKSIRSSNDQAISAYKGINIHVDYSQFDQIKKINLNT